MKESDKVFSKTFRPLFNSVETHRNFPGQVACLPVRFLGLQIPKLYVKCGIARIFMFVNNMGSETLTLKFSHLHNTTPTIKYMKFVRYFIERLQWIKILVTDTWIISLWKFVYSHIISIKPPKQIIPLEIRKRDKKYK